DERYNILQGAWGASLAFTKDDHVISVTCKAMSTLFEFLIQFVEHDIAQNRIERTHLRHAHLRLFKPMVRNYTGIEVFMNERNNPSILYRSRNDFNQLIMIDSIKELFKVHLNGICMAIDDVSLTSPQSLVCASPWSESEAII